MKKNDFVITDIVSMSSEGVGIGKIEQYVLFVPFTCIGDKVKVKILKVKNNDYLIFEEYDEVFINGYKDKIKFKDLEEYIKAH